MMTMKESSLFFYNKVRVRSGYSQLQQRRMNVSNITTFDDSLVSTSQRLSATFIATIVICMNHFPHHFVRNFIRFVFPITSCILGLEVLILCIGTNLRVGRQLWRESAYLHHNSWKRCCQLGYYPSLSGGKNSNFSP